MGSTCKIKKKVPWLILLAFQRSSVSEDKATLHLFFDGSMCAISLNYS